MSSFSSMLKTTSGIPEIYNVKKKKVITNEVEIFFFLKKKVTRQCGTCQTKAERA